MHIHICVCLYLLRDVEVAGVDAVCEQILRAAALTGAKHTVVGLEQLTAERRGLIKPTHYYPLYMMIITYRPCQLPKLLFHYRTLFITLLNAEAIIRICYE